MKLYGGGVIADIPEALLDASDMRPVPDSQEVFVGTVDGQDVSMIVDLCEAVASDKPIEEAARTHIEDIYHMANSKEVSEPVETTTQMINEHETVLRFETVKMANNSRLLLSFALFRLPRYTTDVVVTYMTNLTDDNQIPDLAAHVHRGRTALEQFVTSFQVADPQLFITAESTHVTSENDAYRNHEEFYDQDKSS